ncbi:MAG: hypothetical protein AB8B55_10355 [Mariniblastus sp.]
MRRLCSFLIVFSSLLLSSPSWAPAFATQEAEQESATKVAQDGKIENRKEAVHQDSKPIQSESQQETDATDVELDDIQERLINVLYQSAFSKNEVIRDNAFKMLERDTQLLKHLGAEIQEELIEEAFEIENPDSPAIRYAFKILEESTVISTSRRETILLESLGSQNYIVRTSALKILSKDIDAVLKRLTKEMRNDLTGQHKQTFQLIEHWGPRSWPAVPVLVERYEAMKAEAAKAQTSKDNPKSNSPNFDYLPIVYALAEIGPRAKAGLPIALAAAEEKGDRIEYQIAGLLCLDQIVASTSITSIAKKTKKAGVPDVAPELMEKFRTFAKTVIKTYDRDKNGILSTEELERFRRKPPGMDRNSDGLVSEEEIAMTYAIGAKTVSSLSSSTGNSRRNSKRIYIREKVKKHLDNHSQSEFLPIDR